MLLAETVEQLHAAMRHDGRLLILYICINTIVLVWVIVLTRRQP